MTFVKTKFALPTITRADGTLAGFVQYDSNPKGDRYIWPAERIATYQAQQAAKALAARKKKMFSLFDIFGGSPAPAAAARPGKKGVQTSATLKSVFDSDTHTDSTGGVTDSDGVQLTVPGPGGVQMPSQSAQIANAAQTILNAVMNQQATAAANSGKAPAPPAPNGQTQSLLAGVPNTALYIGGGLAAAGVLIAIAKGGRR